MAQNKDDKLTVNVGISFDDLVTGLQAMEAEDREWFLENLLAATSPDYLESIREAREDYQQGCTIEAEELWPEEAEKRYAEYCEGKITSRPAEQVLEDARRRLQ